MTRLRIYETIRWKFTQLKGYIVRISIFLSLCRSFFVPSCAAVDLHCARRRITEIKFRYQFHVGINLFGWGLSTLSLLVAARTPNDNNNANLWNKYKSNANITKWTFLLFACACDYTPPERFMMAQRNHSSNNSNVVSLTMVRLSKSIRPNLHQTVSMSCR